MLKGNVNFYAAALLITLLGGVATWLIVATALDAPTSAFAKAALADTTL